MDIYADAGTLRETYFASQIGMAHKLSMPERATLWRMASGFLR